MSKFKEYISEAKTGDVILKQIKYLDRWALPSWDAKDFILLDDGVQFDVKGSKFRGRVIIVLDKRNDTYNIELGNIRNLKWKSKTTLKNIFVEDLVNILDQHIG